MKKAVENTAYWIGILTLGIVVGLTIKMAGAWVEPDQMPPGGNIAAPLNTGNVGQAKQGGLTLNLGGATYGLIVDKGLVGIRTTNPQAELDVNGDILAHNLNLNNNLYVGGDAIFKGNLEVVGKTSVRNPVNDFDAANKAYVDNRSDYKITHEGSAVGEAIDCRNYPEAGYSLVSYICVMSNQNGCTSDVCMWRKNPL